MSDELDTASFNKSHKVLKETADWLSGQKEPDIDQLVPKVERAMKAYSVCEDRLDKVQATLGGISRENGASKPSPKGDGYGHDGKPGHSTGPGVEADDIQSRADSKRPATYLPLTRFLKVIQHQHLNHRMRR